MAGSVAFMGVLWDAVTDPAAGNMADRSSAAGGKYRRFVLISILPIVACSVLMSLKVNFGGAGTFLYMSLQCDVEINQYTLPCPINMCLRLGVPKISGKPLIV